MSNQVTHTREQKGHSVTKHILFGWIIAYMNLPFLIYYGISKDHYLHA